MNITIPKSVRETVENLLEVLDIDIQHIQYSLDYLDNLRGLLIKRDETSLSELLNKIRIESTSYKQNELMRHKLRLQLADLMHCNIHDMTLSYLAKQLPEPLSSELSQKKYTLRELTNKLKQEHTHTSWLVMDCMRFNNTLFNAMFNKGRDRTLTYTPKGRTKQHTENSMMSIQF